MGTSLVPPSHAAMISLSNCVQHSFWVLRVHFFLCLAAWPFVFLLPESHGPTILAKRARSLRQHGKLNAFSQEELEPATLRYIIQVHFLRPASESFDRER